MTGAQVLTVIEVMCQNTSQLNCLHENGNVLCSNDDVLFNFVYEITE